ncbi:hypothetical protein [Streptomyces filamentosus]
MRATPPSAAAEAPAAGAALPIVALDDVVGLFAPPSDREGGGR